MANTTYSSFRTSCLSPGVDLLKSNVACAIVTTSTGYGTGNNYTANTTTDQFFSIIPAGSILSKDVLLSGKTISNGSFSCASVTFPSVVAKSPARPIEAIIFYIKNNTDATSNLICYVDTISGSPINLSPNGGNVTVSFSGSLVTFS
jgi:hypothetical protein